MSKNLEQLRAADEAEEAANERLKIFIAEKIREFEAEEGVPIYGAHLLARFLATEILKDGYVRTP